MVSLDLINLINKTLDSTGLSSVSWHALALIIKSIREFCCHFFVVAKYSFVVISTKEFLLYYVRFIRNIDLVITFAIVILFPKIVLIMLFW